MTVEEILDSIGCADYGYTEEPIPHSRDQFNNWIKKDLHLPLDYLSGERGEKRQDVQQHWPEFKSAIVFLFSYDEIRQNLNKFYQNDPSWNKLKIASYTLGFEGDDYHDFLRQKLKLAGEELKKRFNINFKLTLDTHPVLERDLAFRSGLGWFGKNSMLINRKSGSFFILGSILLDQTIPSLKDKNKVETDHCGQCNRCSEACPTQAIDVETRTISAKDCISTFTIEQFKLETAVPDKMNLTSGFIFGCDICQDVCPWNTRQDRVNPAEIKSWSAKQNEILDYFLRRPVVDVNSALEAISGKQFEKKFKRTSFERSGKRGLLKNLRLYLKQTGSQS